MTKQEIDAFLKSDLVVFNRWKFTPRQCLALHLVCSHGSIDEASKATGIKVGTLKWHLKQARQRRKMGWTDIRIYLMWHLYERGAA